jgi:hypothetical protein
MENAQKITNAGEKIKDYGGGVKSQLLNLAGGGLDDVCVFMTLTGYTPQTVVSG